VQELTSTEKGETAKLNDENEVVKELPTQQIDE
jgi:hypothetical protein